MHDRSEALRSENDVALVACPRCWRNCGREPDSVRKHEQALSTLEDRSGRGRGDARLVVVNRVAASGRPCWAGQDVGWGARIRTWVWRNQNPLPYHLATPQLSYPAARPTTRCFEGAQVRLQGVNAARTKQDCAQVAPENDLGARDPILRPTVSASFEWAEVAHGFPEGAAEQPAFLKPVPAGPRG